MKCRIEIECLENGYTVSVPDILALNKAEAEAKKRKAASPDKYISTPYPGDFMKSYAAKTSAEVLKLVTPALKNLPQSTYDEAFAEAAAANKS